jgi:nicotinamide mononucleotide transporter
MSWLVDPLNTVLWKVANDHVTWAELLGFLTGGASVLLTLKRHVLNFPTGLVNSALFLVLFASARLWADAGLQVMFIALGVAGWIQWVRSGTALDDVEVRHARRGELIACVAVVVAGTALLTVVLRRADDAAPFWDALTTSLSVVAQWLLNGRKMQTWWFWIAADCIYIPLYVVKRLDLTALVYVLFLGMCVAGLRSWSARSGQPAPDMQKAPA